MRKVRRALAQIDGQRRLDGWRAADARVRVAIGADAGPAAADGLRGEPHLAEPLDGLTLRHLGDAREQRVEVVLRTQKPQGDLDRAKGVLSGAKGGLSRAKSDLRGSKGDLRLV